MAPRLLTGALITVALITTAACGGNGNTPVTDSARPAVAARDRASGSQIPPRARGRCGGGAALRGRVLVAPARPEAPHLAPLRSGAGRPRHLLRSAVRAQSRDARHPRRDHHASVRRRSPDAGRDSALHEALLAEHGAVQQPDGAEVRPEVHAGGVRGRGEGRCAGRREVSIARTARPSTRCSPGCSRSSSTPRSTCSSPTRRRAGNDILTASANNLYVGVSMKDLEGFQERYPLNSRLVKDEARRDAGRRGVPRRGPLRQGDQSDRRPPRGGDPVRDADDGHRAAGAHQVLHDRRDGRPRGVRHRLGPGQDLAGRHDQRLRGGLHGPSRHEGIVGVARLLREPGEDGGHPQAGRRRAVVRGPHALGGRSTASRESAASPPTRSTSSSKGASRGRSRPSGSTSRTTRRSARSTAASRCR